MLVAATALLAAGLAADHAGAGWPSPDAVSSLILPGYAFAQTPPSHAFVTTWTTTSANQQITLPVSGSGITIDWGDGQTSDNVSGSTTHTYAAAGNYTVSVTGGLERFNLNNGANRTSLMSIERWGNSSWTSMANAFRGATNMVYEATDTPNLSGVTDMSSMFYATSFNGNLSTWDVSSVTDMTSMFTFSSFNGDISSWDVSSVTDMTEMFDSASFNQNISSWDVSSVTYMSFMFQGATAFNQNISSWDVSAVTNMAGMFEGASSFDQPLNSWDVSRVTDMGSMFDGATSFDQPLSTWNVSAVTDMDWMFDDATSFNQDISDWEVSSVTTMFNMFDGATSFNQDISDWDVSRVTDMTGMFDNADRFNQNLGPWYITPDAADFDAAGTSLSVTAITAQNAFLDGQNPDYGIGTGGDSGLFEVASGTLSFKEFPTSNGTHTANVTAAGSVFESGNNWRTVRVVVYGASVPDTTPPVITIRGSNPVTITVGDTYADAGADCVDETDGTLSVTTDNPVNASRVDTYRVTYSCSDSSGNDASADRTVRVRGDQSDIIVERPTRPVITILGSNPAYIGVGDRYDDAGASCSDSFNATLPVRTTHAVDTSEPSTHTVTYTCSNGWHHPQTATRTVIVSGGTSGAGSAPAIHLLAQGGTYYDGTYQYKDYNCVDPEDGIINHKVKVSVAAGASTATITYTCTDRDGNTATATRTVQITDTRPPVVSIIGSAEIRLTVGDSYTELGATCVDDRDGKYAATIDPLRNSVDTSTPGNYAVGYYCLDAQGNEGYAARGVTVVADGVNARPVLTVSDEAIYLNKNDSYTPPTATCTDAEDGDLEVVTDGKVDASKVGTYEVFFTCTDEDGATAVTSVTIYVDEP